MLILSVLLYNAEAWVLNQHEESMLERWHIKLARATVGGGNRVREDGTWESNEAFLKRHGLPTMKKLLFERRIIWIAHLARRVEVDVGAAEMLRERDNRQNEWWRVVERDLTARGCSVEQVLQYKDSQADLKRRILSVDPQDASVS